MSFPEGFALIPEWPYAINREGRVFSIRSQLLLSVDPQGQVTLRKTRQGRQYKFAIGTLMANAGLLQASVPSTDAVFPCAAAKPAPTLEKSAQNETGQDQGTLQIRLAQTEKDLADAQKHLELARKGNALLQGIRDSQNRRIAELEAALKSKKRKGVPKEAKSLARVMGLDEDMDAAWETLSYEDEL
jgi:hypothetical protein